MTEYTSKYYFRSAASRSREPIPFARYVHRARSVKSVDPDGIYAKFNLSSNKRASDKPSIDKGSALFG